MNEQARSTVWQVTVRWLLAVIGLALMAAFLIGIEGTAAAALSGGAATGLVAALLWSAWHREQAHSPMSEYLAVGYMCAWYLTLAFAWADAGDNWVDWMLILPPVSWVPLTSRRLARARTGRRLEARTMQRLHRLAAAVCLLVVAFLVATIIAIVVSPVALLAGVLHLVAARFYARRVTHIPSEDAPSR